MTSIKKLHIKIGDTVQIIAGIQKSIIGKVTQVFKKKSLVLITQINNQTNTPFLIHTSNVMLWDCINLKKSRVGYKININGKKQRYFKNSGLFI